MKCATPNCNGRIESPTAEYCESCCFDQIGEEIERHPIGRPGGRAGGFVPNNKQQEARKRLIGALPFINIAMSAAKKEIPDGNVGLAVIVTNPDNSGKVTATFNGEEMLADIVTLLGFKDMNELIKSNE